MKIRDFVRSMLIKTGAIRLNEIVHSVNVLEDILFYAAALDRMIELGEISKLYQENVFL